MSRTTHLYKVYLSAPFCYHLPHFCFVSVLLDLVAIPDFLAGAMENWGLITFRETTLLLDNNSSSLEKQVVASVIAHELAHQVVIFIYLFFDSRSIECDYVWFAGPSLCFSGLETW